MSGIYVATLLLCVSKCVLSIRTSMCIGDPVQLLCNGEQYELVIITSLTNDPDCNLPCSDDTLKTLNASIYYRCASGYSCTITQDDFKGSFCGPVIDHVCVQGKRTTPRVAETTPLSETAWKNDFGSYQWVIIWIVIAVVVVAIIIAAIMIGNRCCIKFCPKQKEPKFIDTSSTPDYSGSTLNSRTVSMSTLHRSTPKVTKQPSEQEIEEVRAQFGTNKKTKDKDKFFGQGSVSVELSRRSSGDGAPAESPGGKFYHTDDSSSGIGSATFDSRIKNALYDETDTSHDDYIGYTIKRQGRLPVVAATTNGTLPVKTVDKELYRDAPAPAVDIYEDKKEEEFRLDINSWTLKRPDEQTRSGKVEQTRGGNISNGSHSVNVPE